eukprot:763497-Hanusia_phi.AAC.4
MRREVMGWDGMGWDEMEWREDGKPSLACKTLLLARSRLVPGDFVAHPPPLPMKQSDNAENPHAAKRTEWKSRKSDRLVRAEHVLNGLKTDFLQQFRKVEKQRESHAVREKQIRNEYFFKRRNLQVQHELATRSRKAVSHWRKQEPPVLRDPEPVFQQKLPVPRLKLDLRLQDPQASHAESVAGDNEPPLRYIDSIRSQVTRVEVSQEERARLLAMGAATAREEGGENVALATFNGPHWTSLLTKSWSVSGSSRPQTTRDYRTGSFSSRSTSAGGPLTSRYEQRRSNHASALLAAERATNELYMVLHDMNQRSMRRSLSGESLTGSRSPIPEPQAARAERKRHTERLKAKSPAGHKQEEGSRRRTEEAEKESGEETGREGGEEADSFAMVHEDKAVQLKIVGSFPTFSRSSAKAEKKPSVAPSRNSRPATQKPVTRVKTRTRTAPARFLLDILLPPSPSFHSSCPYSCSCHAPGSSSSSYHGSCSCSCFPLSSLPPAMI